jgi:hypothetical protein
MKRFKQAFSELHGINRLGQRPAPVRVRWRVAMTRVDWGRCIVSPPPRNPHHDERTDGGGPVRGGEAREEHVQLQAPDGQEVHVRRAVAAVQNAFEKAKA